MSDSGEAGETRPAADRVGTRAAGLALMTAVLWGGNPVAVSFSD